MLNHSTVHWSGFNGLGRRQTELFQLTHRAFTHFLHTFGALHETPVFFLSGCGVEVFLTIVFVFFGAFVWNFVWCSVADLSSGAIRCSWGYGQYVGRGGTCRQGRGIG
jgi:hypothetical protein